ncbi:MAG TPA: glycosyltransferase [Terriglobia bacterium]|nr:glycosyltransferase [Terriglobia bacterium]
MKQPDGRSNKRLLYAGMLYDYGDPARGLSFEERNFCHPLKRYCEKSGWEMARFDFMELGRRHGQERMSEMLWETVRRENPDYLVSVLFNPQHDPCGEVLQRISAETGTVTLNWFCDDHWRFDSYSRFVAPNFNVAITTDSEAIPKYRAIGMGDRVVKSQWACNQELYRPLPCSREIEVSFVGQPHGSRAEVAQSLWNRGIPLKVFGYGWRGAPRLPFNEMIRVFNRSRINLNLSNASTDARQQIKGRNFEIPGTRSFLLTGPADNLEEYYADGKEVVVFRCPEEMIDRIRYFSRHESERDAIAEAGYQRTIKEHTWEHRWSEIFTRIQRWIGGRRSRAPSPF